MDYNNSYALANNLNTISPLVRNEISSDFQYLYDPKAYVTELAELRLSIPPKSNPKLTTISGDIADA